MRDLSSFYRYRGILLCCKTESLLESLLIVVNPSKKYRTKHSFHPTGGHLLILKTWGEIAKLLDGSFFFYSKPLLQKSWLYDSKGKKSEAAAEHTL